MAALSALSEPQRARIFQYLVSVEHPRTRQQVSDALGIGRTLVAFHLDKLQQVGLVQRVREPVASGRPGRPPQRYMVTQREIIATVPPRRYELLAEILVQAAGEHSGSEGPRDVALRVAKRRGTTLAAEERSTQRPGRKRRRLSSLLSELGYEPSDAGDGFVLTNCPFERLREVDTTLVCSLNAALAAGLLEGLGADGDFSAHLRPSPPNCCVVLVPPA